MFLKKIFKKRPQQKGGFKNMDVGGFMLLANAEHPLDMYLKQHKYYSRNLPRIAKLIEKKYKQFGIIDIGANIGDTIALLRSVGVDQMVYAIEGDPLYFDILKKNTAQFTSVAIFQAFLGEETTAGNFSLETTKGTANLIKLDEATIQIKKLDEVVAEHNFKDVKLLKIDTDGFDFKIIRGSWELIKKEHPVLFFEYDANYLEPLNEDGTELLFKLCDEGYQTALYYDNYGKLLVAINLNDKNAVKQLYSYMRKGEGAFYYYDVCLFHQSDEQLAHDVIAAEMEFFD